MEQLCHSNFKIFELIISMRLKSLQILKKKIEQISGDTKRYGAGAEQFGEKEIYNHCRQERRYKSGG